MVVAELRANAWAEVGTKT